MKIFSVLTIILLNSICTASYINNLNILGNEHTQYHIIQRELYHPIPGEYDSVLAAQDRDRIYNLGLFSTVEINQIDSSYSVFVIETFRILPLPLSEYEEGKGISLGAGIVLLNFRGLNEQLVLGGIQGKQNTYFFKFEDPWAYGNHGSLSAGISQLNTESAVYNYSYTENDLIIGTGLYKGENHKYKSVIGLQKISLDTVSIQIDDYNIYSFDLENKFFNYIISIIKYEYDTRDIYIDPTNGEHLQMTLRPKLGIDSTSNRMSLNLSYKKYFSLKGLILDPVVSVKSQFLLKYTKDLPVFENEYVGGEGFVRGYSPIIQDNPSQVQSKIEGSQIIYQNLQLQHTLIERRDYNQIEAGIDLVYFVDFGISSRSIKSVNINRVLFGYGFGFRFFISGAGIISIDFGYNPYGSWFIHPYDGNY